MLLSTGWGGFACRSRRRRIDSRGFFLVEAMALSFLLLGCAATILVYQALARYRACAEAEITAAYLAQEQLARIEAQPASYLRAHSELPWLGEGGVPVERNRTQFEIASSVTPNGESPLRAEAEVRLRWQAGGKNCEAAYRKLVAYHE